MLTSLLILTVALNNFNPFSGLFNFPITILQLVIRPSIVPEVEEDYEFQTFKRFEIENMEAYRFRGD